MKKLSLSRISAVLVVCGAVFFVACDSGYVDETRKPQDYINRWDLAQQRFKEEGLNYHIPKAYKGGEKPDTQPPFMMLLTKDNVKEQSAIIFDGKRGSEIQSVTINGGKCKVGKLQKSGPGLAAELGCSVKSISKIEIDTSLGKFTYKFQ